MNVKMAGWMEKSAWVCVWVAVVSDEVLLFVEVCVHPCMIPS